MMDKWRRLNARKKAMLTLLAALIASACAAIRFILLPAYPFTPAQALRQYEQEHLYGPSEIVEEFPLVFLPEEYQSPDWKKDRSGDSVYLCRYGDVYSVLWASPSSPLGQYRWSVDAYALFPVPEAGAPVAARVVWYPPLLLGTLNDRAVTRLTVYGMYEPWAGDAFYHTEEAAILPDGHFALALDGWQLLCDEDHPLTLTGYNAQGEQLFSRSLSLTPSLE